MNQEPRTPGGQDNGQGNGQCGDGDFQDQKGSVKRARQRARAELPPEQTRGPVELEAVEATSPVNLVTQSSFDSGDLPIQHPPPDVPSLRRKPPPIGAAIARPAPTAQWPLREDDYATGVRDSSPRGERGMGRVAPPSRPPRPSYVSPLLDPSTIEENASATLGPQSQTQTEDVKRHVPAPSPQYWENNYQPGSDRESGPGPTPLASPSSVSRPSTSSSIGTIPDFPSPVVTIPPVPQTRRGAHLGPPPSARRGASSYYSQSSYVTPIPEELPEIAHGSFASSHAIPTSWTDGLPEYYMGLDEGEEEEEEEEELPDKQDGRLSRSGDHDGGTGLVRSASLGKRHKPSLTTIGSPDLSQKRAGQNESSKPNLVSRIAVATGNAGGATPTSVVSPLGEKKTLGEISEVTFFDASCEETQQRLPNALAKETNTSTQRARSPVSAYADPRMGQIPGSFEKGSTLNSSGSSSPFTVTTPSTSEKVGIRRPPRLNLESVREADTRGSLTSLPDLIRRATRLASNLDRGRTASRMGMWDMFNSSEGTEKTGSPTAGRGSGGLSDMLASFPPPGLSTPVGEDRSRYLNNSNVGFGQSEFPPDSPTSGHRTNSGELQLCGMRRWIFLLLCIIVVFLIAAAVIIPVTLIVLPRRHSNSAPTLASCQKSTPCTNGGTNVISANACRCVCSNGFTGATCTIPADSGCVTSNLGSFKNATFGSSIPKLLSNAQSNFSIPLNSSELLVLFSYANLSCTSENALVTFNSKSSRRSLPLLEVNTIEPLQTSPSPPLTTQRPVHPRAAASSAGLENPGTDIPIPSSISGAITSSGILLAAPTTTGANTSPSAVATATSSAASNIPSSSIDGIQVTDLTLDFARVAVLYIFQETDLNTAVVAQEKLQSQLLGSTLGETSVTTGSIVVNFGNYSVALGNGTTVGGGKG